MMRYLILFFLFLIGTFSGFAQKASIPKHSSPNIIYIVMDDLGWADLGCYGNKYYHTPNMDSLARMGLRYTQAYASSPVCSPSRAGMLSGLNPARLHLTNFLEGRNGDPSSNLGPASFGKYLPQSVYMIPEALHKAGYLNAIIGKWHLGDVRESLPDNQGFDYERVSHNGLQFYHYKITAKDSVIYQSNGEEELTDYLTKEAIKFLKDHKDTTFFLYLAHDAPHLLLQPKPQKLPLYYFTYNALSKGRYSPQYAAVLEGLDDNIGALMKALKDNGLWENTLVILTSDNGGSVAEEFGERPTDNSPLRNGKGTLYEGGLRVPLLMVWKGHILPNTTSASVVSNLDYFPTFLKLAGLSTHHHFDGEDISNSFLDNQTLSNRTLWWHYPHFSNQGGRLSSAILKGEYKLIKYYENGKTELYNLSTDLSEKHDLSNLDPLIRDSLKQELERILIKAKVNMPVSKE